MAEMTGELGLQSGSELEKAIQGYHNAANQSNAAADAEVPSSTTTSTSVFNRKKNATPHAQDDSDDDEDSVHAAADAVHPNVIGKFITETHKQYALTYAMMLGIRNSISKSSSFYNKENLDASNRQERLVPEDFRQIDKLHFLPEGGFKNGVATPPHKLPHSFIFKDYCPKVFRRIRGDLYNIHEEDYMLSLCGNCNFIEFMTNSKSGEFFYYTGDTKYLIKTMSKEESKFMRVLIPHYFEFVTKNPDTFINPFFGMHRVQMNSFGQHVYFMVLGSVFDTELLLHQTYDLKGSKQGREVSEEDKALGKVRKDNNLENDGIKFHLGTNRDAFLAQIQKDSVFCSKMNIMDYSLLVGIHEEVYEKTGRQDPGRRFSSMVSMDPQNVRMSNQAALALQTSIDEESHDDESESESENGNAEEHDSHGSVMSDSVFKADNGGLRARDEDGHELQEIYYIGVIDILQTYTGRKKMETFFKGFTNKTSDISCVPPEVYARRFQQFLTRNSD